MDKKTKPKEQAASLLRNRRLKKIIWVVGYFLLLLVLVFVVMSVFSSVEDILSLNHFLYSNYVMFLLMRLCLYGFIAYFVVRIKKYVVGTAFYNSYKRTCIACVVVIVLNEVMLISRVMGA